MRFRERISKFFEELNLWPIFQNIANLGLYWKFVRLKNGLFCYWFGLKYKIFIRRSRRFPHSWTTSYMLHTNLHIYLCVYYYIHRVTRVEDSNESSTWYCYECLMNDDERDPLELLLWIKVDMNYIKLHVNTSTAQFSECGSYEWSVTFIRDTLT